MEFTFVESLGVTADLVALRTSSQPFNIHMYQHQGLFAASENKLGNGTNVGKQFSDFFIEARRLDSDLVLTPEYSCPWANILEIVSDKTLWPVSGKLWVLGC
jgi:hypothetical protein